MCLVNAILIMPASLCAASGCDNLNFGNKGNPIPDLIVIPDTIRHVPVLIFTRRESSSSPLISLLIIQATPGNGTVPFLPVPRPAAILGRAATARHATCRAVATRTFSFRETTCLPLRIFCLFPTVPCTGTRSLCSDGPILRLNRESPIPSAALRPGSWPFTMPSPLRAACSLRKKREISWPLRKWPRPSSPLPVC